MSTINSEQRTQDDHNVEEMRRTVDMRKISESTLSVLNTNTHRPVEEENIYSGKSFHLTKFTFDDGHGIKRSAEGIQMKHKNGSSISDEAENVSSIAILRRHILCDCLLLVKQYRPPLKSYTLEFPSKYISIVEDEEAGKAAIKTVADDTGYKSTIVKHISPETALDPGKI